MSVRFSKKIMQEGAKSLQNYIKKNKKLPSSITLKDMNGKSQKLTKKQYAGLYENQNSFWIKNNRQPNYTTLLVNANNPLVFDRQNDSVSCSAASLSMAIQMLYGFVSESKCKSVIGVTSNGAGPDMLINGAKKLGYKIERISRNKASVKKALNECCPVITYWQTNQTKSCKGDYIGSFGHYSLIWDITDTQYVVADPSKGVNRKYNFKCMDNANSGHPQYYYKVSIL